MYIIFTPMNDLLVKYIEQIKADLDINQINIASVARNLPARRHFWTARLIEHKIKISTLERQKQKILKDVSQKLSDDSPVKIDAKNINKAAEQSDQIQKINEEITDNKNIVEFLEQVQRNFFSATYDVKNVIDIMKLEQS
jgi:hypothetical protein